MRNITKNIESEAKRVALEMIDRGETIRSLKIGDTKSVLVSSDINAILAIWEFDVADKKFYIGHEK